MARKKSVKKVAQDFMKRADELVEFCNNAEDTASSDREVSWVHEAALIKLQAAFERLVLEAIVGAVNNDTTLLTSATGTDFPKHLTDEVCQYIITGGSYFNFKGRDGLLGILKRFLGDGHYLVKAVKDASHKQALERLFALRNFAAHESAQSKRAAKEAVGQVYLGSSGSWVKKQNRYRAISDQLKKLAKAVERGAPY